MRFIHMADMHFDCAFTNLSDKDKFGEIKRMEQRKIFKKIIEYIKQEGIQYFFISGDLYEQKYIRETTIEYINNLFKEIPNTKIFISPGNHDPVTKNSYYNKFKWYSNVKIFSSKIEKIELEDVNIYGFGFDEYYCRESNIREVELDEKNKINILVIHGTLDGASLEEKEYNSIPKKLLEEKGFDYVALGHIHKANYESEKKIIYPGSTVALGFDELGKHGVIEGNIQNGKLEIKFIPIEQTEFEEINLDCTEIISKEELIEKINELNLYENKLYKIILIGKRNFEINIYDLYELNLDEKIIKIKNKTKPNYDLEKMANENTLKGLFAKKILEEIKSCHTEEEMEIFEKAIEIGMDVLE